MIFLFFFGKIESVVMSAGEDGVIQQESFRSPCFQPDGSFHAVCTVVIGTGVFVAFISLFCVIQIVKLCLKLREDQETDVSLKTYHLHPNSAMLSKSSPSASAMIHDGATTSSEAAPTTSSCSSSSYSGGRGGGPGNKNSCYLQTPEMNADSIQTVETSFFGRPMYLRTTTQANTLLEQLTG